MVAPDSSGPDAVFRIGGQQGFDDGLLCCVVDLGDKVVGFLCEIRTDSMSSAARLMMEPAVRAAFTATLSMGCWSSWIRHGIVEGGNG